MTLFYSVIVRLGEVCLPLSVLTIHTVQKLLAVRHQYSAWIMVHRQIIVWHGIIRAMT